MPLFRRRRPAGVPAAVAEFWDWWGGVRDQVASSLDRGRPGQDRRLQERLAAVHPQLRHGFRAGTRARHALVVSPDGRPELRTVTERWLRSGPGEVDGDWEYHAAAPAAPEQFDQTLVVAGRRVDLAATSVEARADDVRCRLDVGVFNPSFPALAEEEQERLSHQAMRWALGEDDVERWLGSVAPLQRRPLDAVPARMLGSLTTQLASRWVFERWVVLEGTYGDQRLVAKLRVPLHRVDVPLFDRHVAVRLPYVDRTLDGLPGEAASGDLRAFEDALAARIDGVGLLVAAETSSGERLLHLYGDSAGPFDDRVRGVLGGYQPGGASCEAEDDPAWRLVDHLRP